MAKIMAISKAEQNQVALYVYNKILNAWKN
jgi:hypothetical protein